MANPPPRLSDKKAFLAETWLVFGILLFCHCYILNVYPYFINPNVASRVYLAQSIADSGSFQIDPWLTRYAQIQDKALYKGHYYSDKAPGLSFWLAPWAWLARRAGVGIDQTRRMIVMLRWLGLSIPAVIFWGAVMVLFAEYAGSLEGATAVILAASLGTNFFICATQLFAHGAAAIWLFLSFIFLRRLDPGRQGSYWLASAGGFAAAFAFITDYLVSFALPVLFGYALYRLISGRSKDWRPMIAFCAGALVPLAAWAWYNASCFDSPLRLGSFYCDDPDCKAAYGSGFFGMHAPDLASIWGMTFSASRGMFFLSPFLILGIPGWRELWRDRDMRPDVLVSIGVCGAVFLFAMTTVDWSGGWNVASRYLVPALPFYLIGVAGSLRLVRESLWMGGLFLGLAAASIMMTALSAMTFPLFPNQFSNPVYHFAWPLFADGRFTRTMADDWLGRASWIPFAIAATAAIALAGRKIWLLTGRKNARLWLGFAAAAAILAGGALVPEPVDHRAGQYEVMARIVWDMGYGRAF